MGNKTARPVETPVVAPIVAQVAQVLPIAAIPQIQMPNIALGEVKVRSREIGDCIYLEERDLGAVAKRFAEVCTGTLYYMIMQWQDPKDAYRDRKYKFAHVLPAPYDVYRRQGFKVILESCTIEFTYIGATRSVRVSMKDCV